jgi:hypothetical protein
MQPAVAVNETDKSLQCPGLSYLLGGSGVMTGTSPLFRSLLAGLVLTLAQLAIAVLILAPDGPVSDQYRSLVQHDSYWFMNIVDHGYETIVPPINHKVMEVSNVGFFPAYPKIAVLLQYVLRVDTHEALLITAQTAAWGFWSYFFLFCERWNLSLSLRFFGALAIFAHPAAFFLITGYSESLFMMTILGFVYWSGEKGRWAAVLAALHGIVMSATRVVGIACAVFPLARDLIEKGWGAFRSPRGWWRNYGSSFGLMMVSILGAAAFFLYCQLRWGHWNIYMLTQAICWGIEPDYSAVFRLSSYRWLVPAFNDPTELSQMAMTTGALFLGVAAVCELIPAVRRLACRGTRIGVYVCAAFIFYISVSGVASVDMESMVRYEFCVHALIVLALLNLLRQLRFPLLVRSLAMVTVAIASTAGLSVQGWCLWNFTRGNWVA